MKKTKAPGLFVMSLLVSALSNHVSATTMVTGITLSGGTNLTGASLQSGTTINTSQLVGLSGVASQNVQADYDIFWRNGDVKPSDSSLDSVFLNMNVTDGLLNPGASGAGFVNFFFNVAATSGVLLFNPDSVTGGAESWSVSAIDGTGALVGNAVTFGKQLGINGTPSVTDLGDTGVSFDFSRDSGSDFNQNIYGIFIANSEFGQSGIAGVRVTSDGADPSLVAGVIPEPSGILLAGLGSLALLARRRRTDS